MAEAIESIFAGQSTPKDITAYTLCRGVTDFSNLAQFNMYETGYSFFIVLSIPKFLETLAAQSSDYKNLIYNYRHLLEYDFRGMDGIDNITVDTSEINNGISNVNMITKVTMQGGSEFSLRLNERRGSLVTKVHELFLRGIKDPRTQVKRYNGLLKTSGTSAIEPGFENEVFNFLYFVTDNTAREIEKAYLIVAAQIQSAETNIYSFERGDIGWKELGVSFSGYPITGPGITAKAQSFLNWINTNTEFEDVKFGYQALSEMKNPGATGGIEAASPRVSWTGDGTTVTTASTTKNG
jgi:hypothetical protein